MTGTKEKKSLNPSLNYEKLYAKFKKKNVIIDYFRFPFSSYLREECRRQ